jgi:hypothetical protein
MSLISAIGLACLILETQGLFELIGGNWTTAGRHLGWGTAAGTAALLLIRFRNDLIDA